MSRLTQYDLNYKQYQYIFNWIVKCVKYITEERKKYFLYSQIDKNLKYRDCINVSEISIDVDLNTIIVLIKYKENKRPYKVIFINIIDEEPTWLYYVYKSKYLKK